MLSPKNRVQAIKSKFENLNSEPELVRKKSVSAAQKQLFKQSSSTENCDKENSTENTLNCSENEPKSNANLQFSNDQIPAPNSSYLYSKSDLKNSFHDSRKSLTRQSSDPGKKLHRSHAFRCDRSQKVQSPQRHGSCNGRSETSDFTLKPSEKRLSREKLKRLGNLLEDQMKKEGFSPLPKEIENAASDKIKPFSSIPDSEVPKHILDQYAKVLKPKKPDVCPENKQDPMTDSGVSSETEDDRLKLRKPSDSDPEPISLPFKTNLLLNSEVSSSSETMKLERKNPHLILTDTLKKALKQPLPAGPPPKKPPRVFPSTPIPESPKKSPKKDTKQMLEKLEQVLHERESKKSPPESPESTNETKPKEVHYLCTEILDITQRSLLHNQNKTADVLKNCLNSLNCAIVTNKSMTSLPYSRLSTGSMGNRNSFNCFSHSTDSLPDRPRLSTFFSDIQSDGKNNPEHIYDVPFVMKSGKGLVVNSVSEVDSVPRENGYGSLCTTRSKSLEDLRLDGTKEEKIYDVPCDESRPATPETTPAKQPSTDFQKLRSNFEKNVPQNDKLPLKENNLKADSNGVAKQDVRQNKDGGKPKPLTPKPNIKAVDSKLKLSKSTENLNEVETAKRNMERRFATEVRRPRRFEKNESASHSALRFSLSKKDQLDVDRENLNRLMNEIYDTVTAACRMEDQRPTRFPTEADGASEETVKLTRSLTEKRKSYVRRVSSRVAYLDPKVGKTRFRHQTSVCSYKSDVVPESNYSTFRSWKSFKNSQSNIPMSKCDEGFKHGLERNESVDSKFNLTDSSGNLLTMRDELGLSLDKIEPDDKTGCVELPFSARGRGLFHVCLLAGLDHRGGRAYIRAAFPEQVTVPPHIENLIFPETISSETGDLKVEYELSANKTQCYSMVLTDERGERNYGYCRRVLPEGASCCLPLCYCIIGKYRAPGFYYKILKEIESHHGSSEVKINTILQELYETDFPNPGEEIRLNYQINNNFDSLKNTQRKSINLGDVSKSKTLPLNPSILDYYDLEDSNRNIVSKAEAVKTKVVKRHLEPRIDEDNLSILLDCLGAGLLIKVFGSLLLERKVVLVGDNLSKLSSCMEGLQAILYPFVWQQPLISVIPAELKEEILEAPLPILAGGLKCDEEWLEREQIVFEEGMLIDISQETPNVLFYQGDESTILPTSSYKTLKTSLQMESSKNQPKNEKGDEKMRNVLISEAFLRFFVEILNDYWGYFKLAAVDGADVSEVVFEKEDFIKRTSSKQNQFFLEWFTETAMFNHFAQNMAAVYPARQQMAPLPINYESIPGIVDAPLPNFYQLFEDRISRNKRSSKTNVDGAKSNYKTAMNNKVKRLKNKLRDLVT